MSKTRLIPGWAGSIVSRAIDLYAPRVAAIIPSPAISAAVLQIFKRAGQIIEAISDSKPENGEQVEAIVRQFVSEDAIPLADNAIDEVIGRVQNERTRHGLTLLAGPVVDVARILSDDNPADAEQAETILDDFILNPTVQEFVITDLTVPVLSRIVKDPFLLAVILEGIEQGIEQGAIELAEIDVFNRDRALVVLRNAKDNALAQVA